MNILDSPHSPFSVSEIFRTDSPQDVLLTAAQVYGDAHIVCPSVRLAELLLRKMPKSKVKKRKCEQRPFEVKKPVAAVSVLQQFAFHKKWIRVRVIAFIYFVITTSVRFHVVGVHVRVCVSSK